MNKTPSNINIEELSVKDAFVSDIESLLSRGSVISDPAPMMYIPLTPIVIGKKVINNIKKAVDSIKK